MTRASILWALAGCGLAAGCTSTPATPPVPPATVMRPIPQSVQAPDGLSDADFQSWLDGQRTRVDAARTTAHKAYADAELECWHRFAVNDCLSKARAKRRSTLDGLRAEELALNQQERQRTTADKLQQLQEKQRTGEQPK